MHHPHLRRPMSSRQSVYRHPLMHDPHHNRRITDIRSAESDEAHENKLLKFCGVSLELLFRHEHFSMFCIRSTLDVATWRKCSALFFRYRRNLLTVATARRCSFATGGTFDLQQQGIVTVHSYAHYNTTHKRCEKRRWVVQVHPV